MMTLVYVFNTPTYLQQFCSVLGYNLLARYGISSLAIDTYFANQILPPAVTQTVLYSPAWLYHFTAHHCALRETLSSHHGVTIYSQQVTVRQNRIDLTATVDACDGNTTRGRHM